jgi:hypothetical protein
VSRELDQRWLERYRAVTRDADKKIADRFRLEASDPVPVGGERIPKAASESPYVAQGFTRWAFAARTDEKARGEFATLLRSYLPAITQAVGIGQEFVSQLESVLIDRAVNHLGNARFRDRLMEWITEFAARNRIELRTRSLSEDDLNRIVERASAEMELAKSAAESPDDWYREICARLQQRGVHALQELESEQLPDDFRSNPVATVRFRGRQDQLVAAIRERVRKGADLFELSLN